MLLIEEKRAKGVEVEEEEEVGAKKEKEMFMRKKTYKKNKSIKNKRNALIVIKFNKNKMMILISPNVKEGKEEDNIKKIIEFVLNSLFHKDNK